MQEVQQELSQELKVELTKVDLALRALATTITVLRKGEVITISALNAGQRKKLNTLIVETLCPELVSN